MARNRPPIQPRRTIMKIYKSLSIITTTIFLVSAGIALAADSAKRDDNQAKRIGAGIANDSLTKRELKRVQKKQLKIDEMRANGASEAEIQAAQNEASQQIYRLKHNDNKKFSNKVREKDFEKQLDNLQTRLGKGAVDGSLTPKESERIGNAIARVKELRAKLAADGHLSAEEAKELDKKEDALSKMIYKNRHDSQGQDNTKPAPVPANSAQ